MSTLLSKTIPVTVTRGLSTTTISTNDGTTVEVKTIDNDLKKKALTDRIRKYPSTLRLFDDSKEHWIINTSGLRHPFRVSGINNNTSRLTISTGVELLRDHTDLIQTEANTSHTDVSELCFFLNPALVSSWEDIVTIQAVNYSKPHEAYNYFYTMPFDNGGGSNGPYFIRMFKVAEFLRKYNVGDVGYIIYFFKNGNRDDLITWYDDID